MRELFKLYPVGVTLLVAGAVVSVALLHLLVSVLIEALK